ncbi:hypothetical protein LCGC14_0868520 [marine sediment metagenome]|uniref:Uncharacterized protein n=1 Tax=marine sediment metagenome TaxID=412755 RepID=A0A0F9PA59_9ZZZZ
MTMAPWTEEPATPPGTEKKPPTRKFFAPWEANWWQSQNPGGLGNWRNWVSGFEQASKLTAPFSMMAQAPAATGQALSAARPVLGQAIGQAGKNVGGWMKRHPFASLVGAGAAYTGYQNLPQPPGPSLSDVPLGPELPYGFVPPEVWPPIKDVSTEPGADPTLPVPGQGQGAGNAPEVVTVGDRQFWWNATGGAIGTGTWELMQPVRPAQPPGLTAEQEMAENQRQREAAMAQLQYQYGQEGLLQTQQEEASRAATAAEAAQLQASVFANDPYKYWAQMGQGTPEAVARLTGGQVSPGEQFQQGVPLSTPSQQWWGNLLPSEQKQVTGGVNWLGIDPNDWLAMQQRMIPGLGARQMGPQWAR